MRMLSIIALLVSLGSYSYGYKMESSPYTFPKAPETYATIIDVEGRFDLTNNSTVTAAQAGFNSAVLQSTTFGVSRIRPRVIGKLADDLSYVMRFNFVQSN